MSWCFSLEAAVVITTAAGLDGAGHLRGGLLGLVLIVLLNLWLSGNMGGGLTIR